MAFRCEYGRDLSALLTPTRFTIIPAQRTVDFGNPPAKIPRMTTNQMQFAPNCTASKKRMPGGSRWERSASAIGLGLLMLALYAGPSPAQPPAAPAPGSVLGSGEKCVNPPCQCAQIVIAKDCTCQLTGGTNGVAVNCPAPSVQPHPRIWLLLVLAGLLIAARVLTLVLKKNKLP